MSESIKIRRALISVSDKTGLIPLAMELRESGCEIISTGGTGTLLAEHGIPFTEISKVTGNPEAFGGRMKTISFAIESALLFDREKDDEEAKTLGIKPIDMVICNLYPFKKYLSAGAELSELIEQIDIGGPTMIRAAAKNYKYVAVVTNPGDYERIINELRANGGALSKETRQDLMAKAFNLTADYDALIAQAMDTFNGRASVRFSFSDGKQLRYGENSHQRAQIYSDRNVPSPLSDARVLQGIEMSYNNYLDLNSALETVLQLEQQGCVIVKHSNPCGMAEGPEQKKCFELAWDGDPVSAFGGIIAFNREVSVDTATFLQFDSADKAKKKFVEIIAAPRFSKDALTYLAMQKNLRVVEYLPEMLVDKGDYRIFHGALLAQTRDTQLFDRLVTATNKAFDVEKASNLIAFGLKAVKQIKSNAIAIVRQTENGYLQLAGMGSGQPNRLLSIELALAKAKHTLGVPSLHGIENILLVSDAFFPFEDNIELAFLSGIKTAVEPGGSIRDQKIIDRCNELGMNLILTGTRHFKH